MDSKKIHKKLKKSLISNTAAWCARKRWGVHEKMENFKKIFIPCPISTYVKNANFFDHIFRNGSAGWGNYRGGPCVFPNLITGNQVFIKLLLLGFR
jgi:hypothetical protein